ncbi:MAG: hypothetical protein QOF58_8443, partial [Pseudonocardiales bacterium]|nr:hypothetical protein [Pseudonocardiales bacterium]
LKRETLSVSSLVADVVAEAAVAAPAASFSIDVAGDLTVFADGERLHQVLVNLVDNAARHGPTGGLVSVSGSSAGSCVVLEVRDEGPGIAPADRSRIFERFTRGERAGGGGTGLGLAIARWVVDLHGGTIAVVDPGSCIRVTLPR